jgi:SAM-dependent methyltransferase
VSAEEQLGTVGVARLHLGPDESQRASRAWWDADADDYLAEHGGDIGDVDFVWCPEGLREADARLLGDVSGRRVLEVGCGSAPCSRWLAGQGAHPVALDLSGAMLRHAASINAATGVDVPLVQAGAEHLPFADGAFDVACSAFGAVPFVAEPERVMREVARVLRPGGRLAVSDVIADEDMDAATRADMQQWTGCVAGALTRGQFEAALSDAGLVDLEVRETHRVHRHAASAIVRARKPALTA